MMQASSISNFSSVMARSWNIHAAYSSAVRVDWVAVRHWATQSLPSCTAKRVLVLPCSMASSIRFLRRKHRLR